MIIRALVTAIIAVLIFILAAKTVPLAADPYLLPLLILLTLIVTAYTVRRHQHEVGALQQIDALREQIRLSRTRTRRFVVIVVVAGALDLLVWRIDAHIQRSRTWSLRIRNRLSFFEDPSGGPVWEGTVCRTGKARDRSRSIRQVGLAARGESE